MKLRFGFVSVLLLCLGLCSSCEDERFDTGSTMPDGQFIVDYTAEAGKATRALHENVPAGKRINSLTYLLYSEEGTLLKRREVPGLEDDDETWPLRRETMTWEQHEALKDTLETNTTYHAVFIANIDSTELWKDATTDKLSPLKRAGNYDDAYIELPDRAFTDRDMFYYFSKDINSADEGADRDKPYHCDVQLHRIVTRTDFFFEELPEWEFDETSTSLLREGEVGDIITEEPDSTLVSDTIQTPEPVPPVEEPGTDGATGEPTGPSPAPEPSVDPEELPNYPETCTLPEAIQNYLRQYIMTLISDNMETIGTPIITSTKGFLGKLITYFDVDEEDENYTTYKGYVERLKAIQGSIEEPEGQNAFLSTIYQEKDEDETLLLYTHLQNWMLNRLEGNTELTALWKQFEERKDPFYAEVAYDTGGGLNQFYLDRTKASSGSILKTPRVAADTIATFEGKTYRGFNVVGFANPTGNKMTTVRWYAKEEATDVAYTLNMSQDDELFIQTAQGINEKWIIFYRPIASLSLSNWDNNKAFTKIVCDLETALFGETETEEDRALIAAINAAFEEEQSIADYGKTLNEVILTLSWPDLSNKDVLKITPEWKIAKGN